MNVTTWSETPSERVFPGITRQVVQGQQQTMIRYVYEPGAVFPVHSHSQEQVTVIAAGRIEFNVGDQVTTLTAGQVAVIPSNVPHGARVVGDETVETFNAFSPRRAASPFAESIGRAASE